MNPPTPAPAAPRTPGGRFTDPAAEIAGMLKAKRRGDGWKKVKCPAHKDDVASLSIGRGEDGRALLHCHAGCKVGDVLAAAGLKMADLYPPGMRRRTSRRVQVTYDYCDESGKVLYQAVRYFPKGFSQRRPDGKGGWIANMNSVRRVLYRLPEILQRPDCPVWIVEGEKDVEALQACGFVATCNVGGAGKWRDEYNEHLRGRTVYGVPDNDAPGLDHAWHVAESLHGVSAKVRVVNLPTELNGKPVKDVSDFLDAGGTADDLLTRAADAQPWREPPVTKEDQSAAAVFSPLKNYQARVLAALVHFQAPDGWACPVKETLAGQLHIADRLVTKAVRELKRMGILVIDRRRLSTSDKHSRNFYRIDFARLVALNNAHPSAR